MSCCMFFLCCYSFPTSTLSHIRYFPISIPRQNCQEIHRKIEGPIELLPCWGCFIWGAPSFLWWFLLRSGIPLMTLLIPSSLCGTALILSYCIQDLEPKRMLNLMYVAGGSTLPHHSITPTLYVRGRSTHLVVSRVQNFLQCVAYRTVSTLSSLLELVLLLGMCSWIHMLCYVFLL